MNLHKEKILEQLKSSSPKYVSGEAISTSLGLSRAAVWKYIQELRREDYIISAAPRKGYRLEQEPDRLNAASFAGRGIVYYPAVQSTNLAARSMAEDGAADGTVIIAEEQTEGRGRRGRQWISRPGKGLWFSMILRPQEISLAEAIPVTLAAAAALGQGLRRETGLKVTLKWPNDLLLEGKKICGILTELKGEPDRVEYLIMGVGLNVNHGEDDFPPDLRSRAGSLALAAGRAFDRTALFLSLIELLRESSALFFKQGFSYFRDTWIGLNSTLGREVTIAWPGGSLRGTALDLDEAGALMLRDETGRVHRVNYGEIV